jgi:cysteine desulfurase
MGYSDLSKSMKKIINSHGVPEREIYLDSENSGLIFSEALKAMVEAYRNKGKGHPSITHKIGWESYETLYKASSVVAEALNCKPEEIVYTHSGTEANNLAIIGLAKSIGRPGTIIISSIEHLSVTFSAERLQEQGFKVIKVPVNEEGFIDLKFLEDHIDKETRLVSIAAVNHEVGTVQDIHAIKEVVKDKNQDVMIHVDACDAFEKIPFDVGKLNIDLASLSSHKVYGPKGVGVLYVREDTRLEPILYGQLSTQKLWPGIENIPSISGFARSVDIMNKNFDSFRSHMLRLRDKLINGVLETVDHTLLNGPKGQLRSPDNVNISFLYCEGEALTVELSLKGVYVSSGSACTSRVLEPSHVLLAIGRRYEEAHGSILMKLTPLHSDADIEYVLKLVPEAVSRIRSLSPIKPVGGI